MDPKYGPNDKVFAKLRGYPPWPARVEGVADETPGKLKYHVYFYGTGETAICKQEELNPYLEKREQFGKPMKKKGFNVALMEIDAELGLTPSVQLTAISTLDQNKAVSNSLASDTLSKSTDLVKPKAQNKRKLHVKSLKESNLENSAKKLKKSNSIDDDPLHVGLSPKPSTSGTQISRSGRKIKTKTYSDSSDDYNYEDEQIIPEKIVPVKIIPEIAKAPEKPKKVKRKTKIDVDAEINKLNANGLSTFTPGGSQVTLKLNLSAPTFFKTKKSQLEWKSKVLKEVEELKNKIESGEMSVEKIIEDIENPYNRTLVELEHKTDCVDRYEKLKYFRTEAKLIELEQKIRNSLNVMKPDPDACLKYLDELLSADITPLMVKKHPEIVDTLKKLTKYSGRREYLESLSDFEKNMFINKTKSIKSKSKLFCDKIRGFFGFPDGQSLSGLFFRELTRFHDAIKGLSADELILLTTDPTQTPIEKTDCIQEKTKTDYIEEQQTAIEEVEAKKEEQIINRSE